LKDGFVRVAAGVPEIRVADCEYNASQVIALMEQAAEQSVKVLVLPELCITGCTCDDLFWQDVLLDGAWDALEKIAAASEGLQLLTVAGLPMKGEGGLYNCAALIYGGEARAFVPKCRLTMEERCWFAPGDGDEKPFFCSLLPDVTLAVAFGPDVEGVDADLILSPSADPEWSGRGTDRRRRLAEYSLRHGCTVVRATAGEGESTTDLVYGGHALIVSGGEVQAERRFSTGLTICEADVRRCPAQEVSAKEKNASVSATPFLPQAEEGLEEILTIAALGLKQRLKHTRATAAVIGLSGGLDSTLAMLITAHAFDLLGWNRKGIVAVTMPCFGTTDRTRSNAEKLAEELETTLHTIDISAAVRQHFADIGQPLDDYSVTFENGQARERTQVLMDVANKLGGLVIGTGDLSELALGWCTYNGDHMSMYAVNSGIPKTLVRRLVEFCEQRATGSLEAVLRDILDTPVSPELLPPRDGEISQRTEDLVGPYELHDFYLYYAVGKGVCPRKVLELAEQVFAGAYDRNVLLKWLKNFYRRFFSQQFKRSCLPDGPKVVPLSLSPRVGWRMPSDAVAALWLKELEESD